MKTWINVDIEKEYFLNLHEAGVFELDLIVINNEWMDGLYQHEPYLEIESKIKTQLKILSELKRTKKAIAKKFYDKYDKSNDEIN